MIAKRVKRKKGASSFGRLAEYLLDAEHHSGILFQTPEDYLESAQDQKVAWFEISHCDEDVPSLLIADVEAIQAQNTRSKNDKTYHMVVSFPAGEKPAQEVIQDIEQTLCEGIGLGEHQRLVVAHQDTANFHVHIAINKVHPETLRCVEPYYDHYKLNDLCRALETKHQLQVDNRIEHDKERSHPKDMEAHAGEQSLLGWMKEHVKEDLLICIENTQNWQDVHDLLAEYNLEIKPRGAGLVIGIQEKGLYVKASSLSRKLSLKALNSLLGPFMSNNRQTEPNPEKPQYNRGPKHEHPQAQELHAQYKTQREAKYQERLEALTKLQSGHKQYIKELKNWYDQQYKNLRYSLFLSGIDKKARFEALAEQRRNDITDQKVRYHTAKQVIMEKTRLLNWTEFLRKEAQNGNETALSILRSQKQRLPKADQAVLTSENPDTAKDIIYPNLKPVVLKKGITLYRLKDGGQVQDEKGQIQVPKATKSSILLAFAIAQERFQNHPLVIAGNPGFQEKVYTLIEKDSLNVNIANLNQKKKFFLSQKERID